MNVMFVIKDLHSQVTCKIMEFIVSQYDSFGGLDGLKR